MAYELPHDMMELAEAALIAQQRVFYGTLKMTPDALDVIATALSGHLDIFGFLGAGGDAITLLTEADYALGAFRRGARRFEYANGESLIVLAVRRQDFERVVGALAAPRGDPQNPRRC